MFDCCVICGEEVDAMDDWYRLPGDVDIRVCLDMLCQVSYRDTHYELWRAGTGPIVVNS